MYYFKFKKKNQTVHFKITDLFYSLQFYIFVSKRVYFRLQTVSPAEGALGPLVVKI